MTARQSPLLFQTSDTTWQAYNTFGGESLYSRTPGTNPARAYKVSYNRPFNTRSSKIESWVFSSEYPMVRWREANGYNVSYASGVDTDRRGAAAIQQHRVLMSVGHDEYWSANQRANVETARAAGVNLAFFSGNESYWKTRYEKLSNNTGTHVVNLWSTSGTLLGSATASGETPSGWQVAPFATPVPIAANTIYVASYHSNTGGYAVDPNYFGADVNSGALHALSSSSSGGNGVYAYGANSTFPNGSYNASNYWVDIIFNTQ
jgi:hypothetical protein